MKSIHYFSLYFLQELECFLKLLNYQILEVSTPQTKTAFDQSQFTGDCFHSLLIISVTGEEEQQSAFLQLWTSYLIITKVKRNYPSDSSRGVTQRRKDLSILEVFSIDLLFSEQLKDIATLICIVQSINALSYEFF